MAKCMFLRHKSWQTVTEHDRSHIRHMTLIHSISSFSSPKCSSLFEMFYPFSLFSLLCFPGWLVPWLVLTMIAERCCLFLKAGYMHQFFRTWLGFCEDINHIGELERRHTSRPPKKSLVQKHGENIQDWVYLTYFSLVFFLSRFCVNENIRSHDVF